MTKRLYSLTVRGKQHEWCFDVRVADPRYLKLWRDDGLEIDEIANTFPQWVEQLGLTKPWCWLQDVGIIPL